MSNFEKLIKKMRKAQKQYNLTPTVECLDYMEDLEDEVDEYLDFVQNCKGMSFNEVKEYMKVRYEQ